jgi:hypothetical protein
MSDLDSAIKRARDAQAKNAGRMQLAEAEKQQMLRRLLAKLQGKTEGFSVQMGGRGLRIWRQNKPIGEWAYEGGGFWYYPWGSGTALYTAPTEDAAWERTGEIALKELDG